MTPILNQQRVKKLATKHERSRIDDVRSQVGLTYPDSLNIISTFLNRTITSFNEVCSDEITECIRELRKRREFEFVAGVRRLKV